MSYAAARFKPSGARSAARSNPKLFRPDHRWATRHSKRFERVAADVRLGDELTKQPKAKGTLRRGPTMAMLAGA